MKCRIYLTEAEREAVRAQRARLHGDRGGEYHSTVFRARPDGEVEIVYAISHLVRQKRAAPIVEVMAVGMTASDSDRIEYRNLIVSMMAGYRVEDWARPFDGNSWGGGSANSRGTGDLPGPVANPEALEGTRYRYAGIPLDYEATRVATYLRLLRKHPEAELLFKAGFIQLIKSSILRLGRPMAKFIASNRDEIDKYNIGAEAVRTAFTKGVPLTTAASICLARHRLRGIPMPPGTVALAVSRYIDAAGVTEWTFRRHAEHCQALNLEKGAWMPSPKRFHAVAEEVEAAYAAHRKRIEDMDRRKRLRLFAKAEAAASAATSKVKCRGILAVWPATPDELKAEGRAMKNCIGNGLYATRVAGGESLVVFLRDKSAPEKPWIDIELRRDRRRWMVAQCYAARNTVAPKRARNAANALANELSRTGRAAKKAAV